MYLLFSSFVQLINYRIFPFEILIIENYGPLYAF